jgi:hypothetical protein
MHNTNYIMSHSWLLFQYEIIFCSEVGKFQTPFGFGPMVWEREGLLVFKSFHDIWKRCVPSVIKEFLRNEALHGLFSIYLEAIYM